LTPFTPGVTGRYSNQLNYRSNSCRSLIRRSVQHTSGIYSAILESMHCLASYIPVIDSRYGVLIPQCLNNCLPYLL